MDFQVFQDIPQKLTELSEQLVEDATNASYSWTLCLFNNPTQVLAVYNLPHKLVKALNTYHTDYSKEKENLNKLLEDEIVQLTRILPRGVKINGIISVLQNSKSERIPIYDQFITVVKEQLDKQEEQILQVFTTKFGQFLLTKDYKPYMQEMQIECFDIENKKLKVTPLKHSAVNDVLKGYYLLTTYFSFPSNSEPLQRIMFAKVGGKTSNIIVLPRGTTCILQKGGEDSTSEQEDKSEGQKGAGKSKKSKPVAAAATKEETISEKLSKAVASLKTDFKKTIDEIGKGIMIAKVPTLEVEIFSKLEQPDTNQQTLSFSTTSETDSADKKNNTTTYFDCISYVRIDGDHENEVQQHLAYFFEQLSQNSETSIYSYGLLDSPLCCSGEVVLLPNREPSADSKKELHFRHLLPSSFAAFRRLDRLQNTISIDLYKKGKVRNAHKFMPLKALEGAKRYQVQGNYIYHHYMQDSFNDDGWGCAYRSLQSVLSWFIENKYAEEFPIPTHREIQSLLVSMGDKPSSFIGTQEWIGAFEVQYVLNKLIKCECKMLNVSSGANVVDKLESFKEHFLTEGTPIMFGGGVKAFTLMGIDHKEETDEVRFLIMDPHYTGSDQPVKIVEKGGLSWQKADLFLPDHFYNFCMPQRPREF